MSWGAGTIDVGSKRLNDASAGNKKTVGTPSESAGDLVDARYAASGTGTNANTCSVSEAD